MNTNQIILPDHYKVLLAEDNPINQRVAVLSLKRIGVTCDIAQNGLEAAEMYKKNRYNLIFMDMQMPTLDGVSAAIQIREYEQNNQISPATFIIAVTANSFSNDREECFKAGMNEFINKPFNESDLRRVINKALELK